QDEKRRDRMDENRCTTIDQSFVAASAFSSGMTMTTGKAAAAEARFLTISDIATCLNVDPRTVRRWIRSGALPVHRIGSLPRISEDFAAFCGEKASLEMRGAAADALRAVR